ncbi:hypothetical protein ACFWP5_28410 [Streptomyces sp. NPDC058469]|uniref:hypothetical protein n=1 Tax=Streptomyces sp. NPDC058469 TaxID=3346514 RepID=UPI0036523F8F
MLDRTPGASACRAGFDVLIDRETALTVREQIGTHQADWLQACPLWDQVTASDPDLFNQGLPACAGGRGRTTDASGSLVLVRPTTFPLHPHRIVEDVITERQTGAAQELHDVLVGMGQADRLTAHDDLTTTGLERLVHDYRRRCHGSSLWQ